MNALKPRPVASSPPLHQSGNTALKYEVSFRRWMKRPATVVFVFGVLKLQTSGKKTVVCDVSPRKLHSSGNRTS